MDKHTITVNEDSLLEVFVLYTKLFHKPFTKEALLAGLPMYSSQKLFSKDSSKSLFSRVAARAGLKSILVKKPIKDMLSLYLPVILLLSSEKVCILEEFNDVKKQAKVISETCDVVDEWHSVVD